MNSIATLLQRTAPFSSLPTADIERLGLLSQVMRHAKGDVIYNEGDPADGVWILEAGRAAIFQYHADGKPFALDAVQPDELLSPLDRFAEDSATYPCTAIACIDAVSIRIPDRYVRSLYHRHPGFLAAVFALCARQLARLRGRLMVNHEPARQRIVWTLFQLKQSGNTLPYTKREISELAGTTVETTIRILSDFEKKRWIASKRGCITLTDIPRLRSLIGDAQAARREFKTLASGAPLAA